MKDIKFRAWDKNANKMIYSKDVYPKSVYKFEFESFSNFKFVLSKMVNRINVKDKEGDDLYIDYYTPVNADIMQYIGLKDSNNIEIYEGDIVKIEDYFGEDIVGRIIYDKITAGYVLKKGSEKNYFQMSLDLESYVFYVLGNIYENTELLLEV